MARDEFSEFIIEKPVAAAGERFGRGLDLAVNPVSRAIRKFAPKRGFVGADILLNWDAIAGREVASVASPVRISFPKGRREDGVLYIRVKNASYSAVIQYQFPKIIDRVNTYFGYGAVKSAKIVP